MRGADFESKSDWQRALEIFEDASELPVEAREARVRDACQGDEELYSNVQSLLCAHDQEGGFLERAIAGYADEVAAGSTPERIGPYRVISELGRGGMAAVYLAERDDQQYRSRVAIKLVNAGSASHAEMRRRFLAERQILASLRHPNIAQLHDGGITGEGVPYLVMEYIDGLQLDEYCSRNQLSIRRRVELFRQVCSGVQFAHRNLVVHRDIKPSNILVNEEGVPKLLDFGIAKLLRPGEEMQTAALTQPAQRLMTLEYASPEQLRGEAVTTAADIYTLGVVLYELLAERHPFEAHRTDFLTLERAVCATDPVPPSSAVRQRNPPLAGQIRGDLDHIVLKAIRKEPAARYESAEHLAQDLQRYLDGHPVEARQGNRRYRMGKFVRRHPLGVAAAAAFLILLASFSAGMGLLAARVTRERNEAQQQRLRAEKVSSFLNSMFLSVDPNRNGRADLKAKDLLDQGAARVTKELSGVPRVGADLLETIGQAYKHLGFTDQANQAFRQEADAVARAYGPQSPEMGRMLRQLGDSERLRGKLPQAETDLRTSVAILEKLPPGSNAPLSHALNNMALVLQAERDYSGAEADFRRAIAISRQYPSELGETLTMTGNLGLLFLEEGRNEEADAIFREVLAGRRKLLGERHPQVAITMRALATSLANRGRLQEAEALYREALAKDKAILPADHSDIVLATWRLAGTLRDEGKFQESESEYREALAADARTIGEHGNAATHYGSLALLLFLEGRNADAAEAQTRAIDIVRADGGAGSVREARMLTQIGALETAEAHYDAASHTLEQALATFKRNPKGTESETAAALFQQAELEQLRGYRRAAEESYGKAIEIDRGNGARGRYPLALHLFGYAGFLSRNQQAGKAWAAAREALTAMAQLTSQDSWELDSGNSVLAEALAAEGNYAEAASLAEQAYARLSRQLGADARPTAAAAVRLHSIYQAMNQPAPVHIVYPKKHPLNILCCAY